MASDWVGSREKPDNGEFEVFASAPSWKGIGKCLPIRAMISALSRLPAFEVKGGCRKELMTRPPCEEAPSERVWHSASITLTIRDLSGTRFLRMGVVRKSIGSSSLGTFPRRD